MTEKAIEALKEIIAKANSVGNPFVDENIAKAIYDAGYRQIDSLPELTDEEMEKALPNYCRNVSKEAMRAVVREHSAKIREQWGIK